MDRLELARSILIEKTKNESLCDDRTIKNIFDTVDLFIKEAHERQYIKLRTCPDCGEIIKIIDLNGQFRVQCGCKKASGRNEEEAFMNYAKGKKENIQ